MILVDVWVPETGKAFDVEADEELKSEEFVRMVAKLVSIKEHMEYQAQEKLLLFVQSREAVLQEGQTLKEQGIRSGEKLYLL